MMQELGSKYPRSSELLPIAAAFLVLWGPQRDTAALRLVFLLFSPISLLLLVFLFGRRCSLSKNTSVSGISHRARLQMKPDGS